MPLDDFDPTDLDAPSDPAHPEPPRSRRLRLRRWMRVALRSHAAHLAKVRCNIQKTGQPYPRR